MFRPSPSELLQVDANQASKMDVRQVLGTHGNASNTISHLTDAVSRLETGTGDKKIYLGVGCR